MGARVLIVGTGAREHAIALKLRQSPHVDEIFVAPGNPGTAAVATNLGVQPKDIEAIVRAAVANRVDFYLASSDDPQALGLVDRLQEQGILCYGPTQAAAQIEASKAWAKQFMWKHAIRTATGLVFDDYRLAFQHVSSLPEGPMVVKASGLAAGKGAIVCDNQQEALDAIDQIMVRRAFGDAGNQVVVEERLSGWETSAHAFCDGKTAVMMPFASDHKRALDGDLGLNTGGMGAYSPSERVTAELAETIRLDVVEPAIRGMAEGGTPFSGILFPGLMVTESGPYVIEFNARWGDPETQALLVRLESDLFEISHAAALGKLHEARVEWSPEPSVAVVIASGGYPGSYPTGLEITGIDDVDPNVLVLHAGTALDAHGRLVTAGGRVLTVVVRAPTFAEARARAYDNVRRIHFDGMHYRTDIGAAALTSAAT
ncbi:MAG TPA: phosphoribosylamine--glycine ligase [Tepidiformaceae bacterium]|nr:phosphoribosylamine--glycine ligase [Tepidiformaceae bacterium]